MRIIASVVYVHFKNLFKTRQSKYLKKTRIQLYQK